MEKAALKAAIEKEIKTWPGACLYYHPEWGCERMDVAGKMFSLLCQDKEGNDILTVKGAPEDNFLLRTMFPWIVPGYYTNKDHWNSILLESEQWGEKKLLDALRTSYDLVVSKLPKKTRDSL